MKHNKNNPLCVLKYFYLAYGESVTSLARFYELLRNRNEYAPQKYSFRLACHRLVATAGYAHIKQHILWMEQKSPHHYGIQSANSVPSRRWPSKRTPTVRTSMFIASTYTNSHTDRINVTQVPADLFEQIVAQWRSAVGPTYTKILPIPRDMLRRMIIDFYLCSYHR